MNRNEFIKGAASVTGMGITGNLMNPANDTTKKNQETKSLNLKITDVKTFVVNREGSNENFVYVKIYTNQGITGLGEGTQSARALTVEQAILEHKSFLIGRDPGDIEWLWQYMYRALRYRGGNILMDAISAIEIALWDIKGKALGEPIWKILGGKPETRFVYIFDPVMRSIPKIPINNWNIKNHWMRVIPNSEQNGGFAAKRKAGRR